MNKGTVAVIPDSGAMVTVPFFIAAWQPVAIGIGIGIAVAIGHRFIRKTILKAIAIAMSMSIPTDSKSGTSPSKRLTS